MIEFYKHKDDGNVIVMREYGKRGRPKETRILLLSHDELSDTLGEALAKAKRRKKAKGK